MVRSVFWQRAVWLVIAIMWGSVACASVHYKPSHPDVLAARQAKSAGMGITTKQSEDGAKQPNPNLPTPPVSAPEQKGSIEAVATAAVAAIEASRHSTEESKKFYEGYTQLLAWGAAIISGFGLAGGWLYLKSRADDIAKQAESTTRSLLDEKIKKIDRETKSLLDAKMTEIDSQLKEKTDKMEAIERSLNEHIQTYDGSIKGLRQFQGEISSNLQAFAIVFPTVVELGSWIGQHAQKLPTDPSRVDPQPLSRLVLKSCTRALTIDPKDNYIIFVLTFTVTKASPTASSATIPPPVYLYSTLSNTFPTTLTPCAT